MTLSNVVIWVSLVIYAAVVVGWWARHVLISLIRPMRLRVLAGNPDTTEARVSVIIPARNERSRVGDCVKTLLHQGPVVAEIVVVDDRSDDGTAEIVCDAAGGDARVRLLRIDALPDDWAGKAHACHRGAATASSEWLLFADADCRFLPGGLAGATAYAEREGVDLLSLWLAADHRTFWEHLLIPLCGAIILLWFPPIRANRAGSRVAYANGQFILVRRDAYRRIGGHACSRGTVIEDIPLAQHAKRHGLHLRTALGPAVASVRMYTGFGEIWNGWTRIFIGALQARWKLGASIASLMGGSLLPSLGAPWALLHAARHGLPHDPRWAAVSILLVLHVLAVYSVSYRLWGLCGCDRRYLGLYPVSVIFTLAILARAWWSMLIGRRIVWRGTPTGAAAMSAGDG